MTIYTRISDSGKPETTLLSVGPLEGSRYFLFHFGAYGWTRAIVQSDSLDSALEGAMDLLAEHAPGHFVEGMCETCGGTAESMGDCCDCDCGYPPDHTVVGHTTYPNLPYALPAIPSWEWTATEVDFTDLRGILRGAS